MDRALVTLTLDTTKLILPTLSFCQPTPAKIKEWANDLPIANRIDAARQLYHALHDLNHFNCDATTRYQLLEEIFPLTRQISDALIKNFLTKSVSLNEQQRKVANITQAINTSLSAAYRLVVQQYINDSKSKDKKYFTESIYRTLECFSLSLLCSQQLYVSPPENFWLQFNELFSLAERLNLTDIKINFTNTPDDLPNNIRAIYATTLLFYTCKPAQLRQSEQLAVFRALPNWSHFVKLHSPAKEEDLFVIRLDKNMPPIYQSFFTDAKNEESAGIEVSSLVKGFNASGLVENLKQNKTPAPAATKSTKSGKTETIELKIPADIDHALMTHLVNTWGVMAVRTAERKNIEGNINICIGLTAAHYYISGGVSFEEQMQAGTLSNFASTTDNQFLDQTAESEKTDDAWADQQKIPDNPFYDTDISKLMSSTKTAETNKISKDYPITPVSIVNISATGCCLLFKVLPPQLHSGEIIGIQSQSGWRIGAIRWVRHAKDSGIQIGVEFLSTNASPCGAKLLHKSGETSAYMRTLLLSTNNLETLITPRIPFKEGSKAYIKVGSSERRIHLSHLIAATGGFCQFKFNYINELPK